MSEPPRTGGIVVWPTLMGQLYLIVPARSTAVDWVLPKGHIDDAGKRRETPEQVMLKQLDLLHERMKETPDTANAILSKCLFGGLIAVSALLNADLVLLEESAFSELPPWLLLVIASLLVLTAIYFGIVTSHYTGFSDSHPKLQYKFELTLHSLLLRPGGVPEECSRRLEHSVDKSPEKSDSSYPGSASRAEILDYILDHHRTRLGAIR